MFFFFSRNDRIPTWTVCICVCVYVVEVRPESGRVYKRARVCVVKVNRRTIAFVEKGRWWRKRTHLVVSGSPLSPVA